MDKVSFDELKSKMEEFNLSDYQATICKNIKRMRKNLYSENRVYYKENNLKNPYTAEAIAELLGISHEYYKRIESFDKTKPISLKLLLKTMRLFNVEIDEFFR